MTRAEKPYRTKGALILAIPSLFALLPAWGLDIAPDPPAHATKARDGESHGDAAADAKVREVARAALVTVHVAFRKDPEEMQASPYSRRREREGPEDLARLLAHRFVDEERTLDLPGLWFDRKGTVLIPDLSLPAKYIGAIEVRTGNGQSYPATLHAVLRDAPGWLLSVQAPNRGPFPAPAFVDPGEIRPETELTAAGLCELDGVWSIVVGNVSGVTVPFAGGAGPSSLIVREEGESGRGGSARSFGLWHGPLDDAVEGWIRPFFLLLNGSAVPVGVALHDRLPADAKRAPAWRGPDLRRDETIPFATLQAIERRLVEAAAKQVAEVRLTFRLDTPEEDAEGSWAARQHYREMMTMPGMDDERGREMTVYGLAVDPRRFFIPLGLQEAIAARIERIDVSLPGRGAPVRGRFAGAFKAFAGFIVETETPLAEPPADLFAVEAFPRVRPIPTLQTVHQYGRRRSVFGYARVLSIRRGYKHRLYDVPDPPQAPGTFLFDLEGRPAGFIARLRREDEKVRALREPGRGYDRWDDGLHSEDNRLFLFRDVRAALTEPAAAFDPDVRVKTKFEERRHVWLGVEYCLLNRELSRRLGIEGPTKSGQVGVMVVDVYDDSPARKIGLKDGDVLLKVQERGGKEPIELRFVDQEMTGFHRRYRMGGGVESEEEIWLSEPPWRPQRNLLTTLLSSMGKGKTIDLTCGVDGKTVTKELVLEEGPPDYESAERKKHEATGLTVRDLTYEVRRALKLPKDAPGVVVSKVEEGHSAAVAKIHPFDVIQRVDGKAIGGAEDLVGALDALRAAGATSVKVQTLRLNRTRFVDLRFEVGPEARKPSRPAAPEER